MAMAVTGATAEGTPGSFATVASGAEPRMIHSDRRRRSRRFAVRKGSRTLKTAGSGRIGYRRKPVDKSGDNPMAVDTLARTLARVETPIGILTAVVGAPFFLWLLARTRQSWG